MNTNMGAVGVLDEGGLKYNYLKRIICLKRISFSFFKNLVDCPLRIKPWFLRDFEYKNQSVFLNSQKRCDYKMEINGYFYQDRFKQYVQNTWIFQILMSLLLCSEQVKQTHGGNFHRQGGTKACVAVEITLFKNDLRSILESLYNL